MKLLQYLLLTLFLGLPVMGWAQERVPATIHLVDGSEVQGYIKPFVMGSNSLTYSTEPSGELRRMKLKRIYRIVTNNGTKDFVYEVVTIRKRLFNKNKGLYVLYLEVDGYMKLYSYNHMPAVLEYFIKKSPDARGTYTVGFAESYDKADGTKTVSQKLYDRQFRKRGAWFFTDHPEIVQEIKNKQVGSQHLRELVTRYNQAKEKS